MNGRAHKLDRIEHVMRRVYVEDSPPLVEALGYLNEMRRPWWKRLLAVSVSPHKAQT